MILFITRKHPPMIGGMEQLSFRLTSEVARRRSSRVLAWGGSQRWLPVIVPLLAARAIVACARRGRERVRLIHVGDPLLSPLGRVLGRGFGVPTVCTAHGLDVTWPFPPYQAIVPRCLAGLDQVVAISEATRWECLARGVRADRCRVIPVGVDLPQAGPDRAGAREALRRAGYPIDDAAPLLLSVGRLVRRKGIRWFAEQALPLVLRSAPSATYIVAGDGPDGDAIRRIAADLPAGRLIAAGRVSFDIRDLLYRSADVFVMPNLLVAGDIEGFGVVAAESAAFGLPVVAADVEGIRDVVLTEQTGLLIPPGDAAACSTAIRRLVEDRELARRLGDAARERAATELAWPSVAGRYIELFDELISRSEGRKRT